MFECLAFIKTALKPLTDFRKHHPSCLNGLCHFRLPRTLREVVNLDGILLLQHHGSQRVEVLPSQRIRNIKRASYSALHQVLALNESPKYKVGGDANKALLVEIIPSLEEFLRTFDDLAYGIPNTKTPILGTATLFDPSRAPKGKHTLYLYQYEPYHLKESGAKRWDEVKQEVADGILETVRKHAVNMGPENILGRHIISPLDLERYNPALMEGSIGHLGVTLSRYMSNRPLPGWGQYRTPVKKLYMCGPSTHPGEGVSGGGRATVQVVMEDMGIDFKKLIAK